MNDTEGQCPLVAMRIMTFSINHNDHWKCWCHTSTDVQCLNKQNSELFAVLTDRVHLYHHQACCHLCRTLAAVASPCRGKISMFVSSSVVFDSEIIEQVTKAKRVTFPAGGRRWFAAAWPWRAAEGRRCWGASAAAPAGCCSARRWSVEAGGCWLAAARARRSEPRQQTAARPEGTQARPVQWRHLETNTTQHNRGQTGELRDRSILKGWSCFNISVKHFHVPLLHVAI